MRGRKGAILAAISLFLSVWFLPNDARGVKLDTSVLSNRQYIAPQQISDTCDWWGARWQFGWRGYGWYACWEQAKPFPTFVDPQETPPEALPPPPEAAPQGCVKRWRDSEGKPHARRIC